MNEGPIKAEERAGPLGSRHWEGVGAWGQQGCAQDPPLPSLSQESTAEAWTDIRVRADPGSISSPEFGPQKTLWVQGVPSKLPSLPGESPTHLYSCIS